MNRTTNITLNHLAPILLATMAFVCNNVLATTIDFRDGQLITVDGTSIGLTYNSTHDAELRESAATSNFDLGTGSSDPEFTVDLLDGGAEAQVVMRFDNIFGSGPGQVALGSVINSATLFIDIDNVGADLELYELTADFGLESTVTWDSFGGGVTAGVNAGATPVSIINGGGNKVTIDITSTVASWSAGAQNFGWAFIATGTNGVDFDASENSDFADRPMIFIDFTAPPAAAVVPLPPSLALALPAFAFLACTRRRRNAA